MSSFFFAPSTDYYFPFCRLPYSFPSLAAIDPTIIQSSFSWLVKLSDCCQHAVRLCDPSSERPVLMGSFSKWRIFAVWFLLLLLAMASIQKDVNAYKTIHHDYQQLYNIISDVSVFLFSFVISSHFRHASNGNVIFGDDDKTVLQESQRTSEQEN